MKLSIHFLNFKSSYPRQLCRVRNKLRYQSGLLKVLSECSGGPKFLTCYVHRMLRRTQEDSKLFTWIHKSTLLQTIIPRHMHAIFYKSLRTQVAFFIYSRNSPAIATTYYATHFHLQAPKVPILSTYPQERTGLKQMIFWNLLTVTALEARPVPINSAKSGSICTSYGAGQMSLHKMACTFYYFCCFLPCRLCGAN